MRYEIITDSRDLLVLVVNSRVIEVSHRMSKICDIIEADHKDRMIKAGDKPINPITKHEETKKEDKAADTRTNWEKLLDLTKDNDKLS